MEDDDKVGNAVGKWGAIGLVAGGVLPYIIGGWIKEYSLLTALGGAFLLGFIALEGAKAHAEEMPQQPPAPPQPPPPPPQNKVDLQLEGSGPIEDAGFLRRKFLFNASGHSVEVMAVVDYNGVGPSGASGKTAVKFIYTIPSLNKTDGLFINYVSTERAIEVFTKLDAEMINFFVGGMISKDLNALISAPA